MSDDVDSVVNEHELNPIDRLSEKLESIRTVHSMSIIGAEKEAAEKTEVKKNLIERYRSGKRTTDAPGAAPIPGEEIDHSELSADGAEDALLDIDATLLRIAEVPFNSRANYVISMNSAFEMFLGELLSYAFTRRPECLKTNTNTLSDQVLVEAIFEGRVMETLVSARVRKIMADPLMSCAASINKLLSINTSNIEEVKELNLVRNCLVHNDGVPSQELIKQYPLYAKGGKIMLDEAFLTNQHRMIFRVANELWIELKTVIDGKVPVIVPS